MEREHLEERVALHAMVQDVVQRLVEVWLLGIDRSTAIGASHDPLACDRAGRHQLPRNRL